MRRILIAVIVLGSISLSGQDLEPRSLSNAPVGLNFVLAGYQFATGNVLFDPSLPIEDAKAHLHSALAAYVRTINFFGRSGKIDIVVPFVLDGHWEGLLEGQPAQTTRTGFADPQLRLSVNILGAPALSLAEFGAYQQKTIVGLSVQVRPPLGEYSEEKLINLGSNRWTFKPQLGISQKLGKVFLEGYFSLWIFTPNPNLLGARLTQKPIYAIKGHIAYQFKPGLWLAFDAGYGAGGRTSVNSFPRESQRNIRIGGTFAVPLATHHALKLRFSSGVETKVGSDFESVSIAYQYRWWKN